MIEIIHSSKKTKGIATSEYPDQAASLGGIGSGSALFVKSCILSVEKL